MERTIFGLLCLITFTWSIQAQEETRFTVEVSTDSILFGNYFKVTFSLENAKGGEFIPPDFSQFHVVSGPNQASSMSIMNGEITQSISYSYYLEPKEIGNFYILPASVEVEEQILETQPIEIMVVPNPEGIKQDPDQQPGWNMDRFGLRGFDNLGDGFPDMDGLDELFRQMLPGDGGLDGFQFFRDSMPSFDLDEFFRMMPELRMEIPDQLREQDPSQDGKRKKKRKIYKI